MKIGILTYHYGDNYGALLQAYALSKILERHGHDVEVINLVPQHDLIRKVKRVIRYPLTKNFRQFRSQYLNIRPRQPFVHKDIQKHDFTFYDAIIVGSDQVWRKSYTPGLGYTYFLNFVPKGVKRIAYAASFGLDYYEGDESDVAVVAKELKKFDLITNREKSGVEICESLFGAKSHCVLDPVLLCDAVFDNFLGQTTNGNFVVQYLLDSTSDKLSLVKRIAERLGKDIYINYRKSNRKITFLSWFRDKEKEMFPSVGSWIRGLKSANFVVTDSFHGVAFSILFQKQFICIVNKKRGSTRMLGLLEQLGLENRAVSEEEISDIDPQAYDEIRYNDVVTPKLDLLRKKSKELLLNSLNK